VLVFSAVVKLLVDSADPAEIGACVADKDTRGVTTSALSLAEAARRAGGSPHDLLRAICGLQPIASGSIQFDGQEVSKLPAYERARRGVALVPQGREIFPLLTVRENLETGFAPVTRDNRKVPDEVFELFPVLQSMLRRRGGDLSGGQQQQLAIARALAAGPKLLILDEPTEGIQPSIIKDIGRVIRMLADRGLSVAGKAQRMAIVLVEQYYDFAAELADQYLVMERGEIIRAGRGKDMAADGVRQMMSI